MPYDASTLSEQFKEFSKAADSPDYDPYASIFFSVSFLRDGQTTSGSYFTYSKLPATEAVPAFVAPLVRIQPQLGKSGCSLEIALCSC